MDHSDFGILQKFRAAAIKPYRHPGWDCSPASSIPESHTSGRRHRRNVARILALRPVARVDIVGSEIPASECPDYASPSDRNYLRYAKFADLDTGAGHSATHTSAKL
ncbi:hypothetical protein OHB12_11740 [Nocardia sp. NBC_01730]|uniref:hypothetical protein n=1 Tax=Nocardia sp. NBC_01730 TaxID=2975998 RepID=UPI002E14BBEF|nr:hypothetical protein OHB12_11740 [Nocardia sp. NBC_01730]